MAEGGPQTVILDFHNENMLQIGFQPQIRTQEVEIRHSEPFPMDLEKCQKMSKMPVGQRKPNIKNRQSQDVASRARDCLAQNSGFFLNIKSVSYTHLRAHET